VLDRGSLATAAYTTMARRLMQKLSEARDQLPTSLFINGVSDADEHPTFAGGFGDVYRASYDGKRVALKRIRTFTADSTNPTRLVSLSTRSVHLINFSSRNSAGRRSYGKLCTTPSSFRSSE
jgi:hypothetical protein